jgi:hypothetical protein
LSRRVIALAASLALAIAFSATAYATNMFGIFYVANMIDPTIASSFDSDSAVEINESQVSGDYIITLLGMAQGDEIQGLSNEGKPLTGNHTYLAVKIEKAAGAGSSEVGLLHILPMISGEKPWQVQLGEYNQGGMFEDGVLYSLIDVENLEYFADRTVYLAVMDTPFYEHSKFIYDEASGKIQINPQHTGVVTLFELPLDASKANPEEAAKIIAGGMNATSAGTQADKDAAAAVQGLQELSAEFPGEDFIIIEDSVKEIVIGSDGSWEYNGYQVMGDGRDGHDQGMLDQLKWNKNGYAMINYMTTEKDGETYSECTMLKKEADGKIYGMVFQCPTFEFINNQ